MANETRLTIELEVVLRRLNQTMRGLTQLEQRLRRIANIRINQQQVNTGQRAAIATQRLALAQQRLQLQQQRLQLQQQRLTVATQQTNNAQGRAALAAQRLQLAQQRLAQGQQRLVTGLTTQNRLLPQFQQRLNSLGAAALRVGGGLRSMGASASILVTGPLVALGTLAAKSAADIDAIRNRLIATEGSLEAANARLAQLRRLADQSIGVTRRGAVDTFAILATLGEVTEDTINKQIRAFGRLNAAFTIDDQQLFFRNLLQIFQQGFEVKDIKEALGRVPIFNQLLAQAFGTADPERLRELKAAGKLTLDTFLAGLATAVETDPVLGQIGESFRVRFAKTIERITDALEPLGLAILGPLERIVNRVEPIIIRLGQAFARLPEGVQTAIVVVGILTAALGPVLFILGGLASGIGAIATALAALLPVLGSIGLPALAAILAGLALAITELVAVVGTLGLVWQRNFLNIRGLVTDVATAIVGAFNRIRTVVNEATRRILPTLQSITTRILGAVTAVWERYGATIVQVVGTAFRFIVDFTVTFIRVFTDFIDLVLKLIDGDWRGAWRAFARIAITFIDQVPLLILKLNRALVRAFVGLSAILLTAGRRLLLAASRLSTQFIVTLAAGIVAGAMQVRDAIVLMLLTAVLAVNPTSIVAVLIAKLLAALRKAAAEGLPAEVEATVGVDVGAGAGLFRRARRRTPPTTEDEKDDKSLRRQLDRLREAQDKLAELREETQLAQLRSQIETQFDAAKQGLEREEKALEDSFDDRLTSLKRYLAERKDLQEQQVDAEIVKELQLTSVLFQELSARGRAAEREFQTELREIEADPKLKGRARAAAIEAARLKKAAELEKALSEFRIKHAEASARVVELEKDRTASAAALLRLERELTREIDLQKAGLRADLLEQQGRTADAESIRLRTRFTETLRDLRIDVSELSADLQEALNNIDLRVLQQRLDELPEPVRVLIELLDIGLKRAQVAEAQQLVDDLGAQLQLDTTRVQNRVLDGLISQREAQAEIVELQKQYKGLLLDILKGELAKAEAIKDQGQIVAIQAQIAEVERLGVAIDEVGQQINQALFSDLQSGLSGIFSGARKGFEGLRDAAISFGERLLDTLNDIAATSILQEIEGLFKPDATDTKGTVGGFIAKLFGLQPKQAADAAAASATLQAGATTASTTFATGVTTSATTFGTSVVTSATSFASLIISAATAFAALVTGSGAAQAAGGAGSALAGVFGGGAATGLFPAVPGGVYKFVEGGHPEAVLTTDPKHAARQVAILRAFLRETRGLGGRIKEFAAGAFINPSDVMFGGMSGPMALSSDVGSLAVAGAPSTMRLRQVLVDERSMSNWVNSSEGEQVMVDWLYKHQPVIRKIGGGRK